MDKTLTNIRKDFYTQYGRYILCRDIHRRW